MRKEEIKKFYQTYRLYIFPAIVAVSSLILIIFVIYPQVVSLITNQKNTSELQNRHKSLEVKAQVLENLNSEDLSKKLDLSLSSYPDNTDFGTVIGLIQSLTSESGFNATSITIGTNINKVANAQSYPIKLSITGPRSLFNILISNIEKSTRLIRISGIEITNSLDQQTVNATLSLDVLYAPIPSSFGNIDSPVPDLSEKDEALLASLAKSFNENVSISNLGNVTLPPRGKANPFE